ncbi:MAG: tyrosine-type recombinase/integrase [Alphaproteobacteria bacterium]|nr:tyrosine-type recombinase/integrase [Alphaproteobacteria bacterium]MBO6629035.1 tyrosine-type recombinase/integrase [Alphaproteobacteria bacterium]
MPQAMPPRVQREITRHGKVVYYVRPQHQGRRIRMHQEPFSKEWWAEYNAIMTGQPVPQTAEQVKKAPVKGNLSWLIAQYRQSGDWARLSIATRKNRENIYRNIVAQAGDVPYDRITRTDVVRGQERRASKPFAARDYLKALRALFKWAVANQHAKYNPTEGVRAITPKNDGFHTWTEGEIARFREYWPMGTRERLAFEVLLNTGLRRGDAVKLGRQHIKHGVLTIKTEKTGDEVSIPVLPDLAEAIRVSPTGDLALIVGKRGRPFVKESFGTAFREACGAAGVPGSAHGLRKAAAVRLAENGATVHQLMAWFGWTDDSMAKIYTRTADRRRMALEAGDLWERPPAPKISRPHPKKRAK